jgi:hypothetical protein
VVNVGPFPAPSIPCMTEFSRKIAHLQPIDLQVSSQAFARNPHNRSLWLDHLGEIGSSPLWQERHWYIVRLDRSSQGCVRSSVWEVIAMSWFIRQRVRECCS